MPPVIIYAHRAFVVYTILRQTGLLKTRKDVKAYKKALESSRAREQYLASMIDNAGIELSEFDIIALSNM